MYVYEIGYYSVFSSICDNIFDKESYYLGFLSLTTDSMSVLMVG